VASSAQRLPRLEAYGCVVRSNERGAAVAIEGHEFRTVGLVERLPAGQAAWPIPRPDITARIRGQSVERIATPSLSGLSGGLSPSASVARTVGDSR